MADVLHARLSDPIPFPELSKAWESERTSSTSGGADGMAPEIVIETHDCDVELRFPSGGKDPTHQKLKSFFERAVQRDHPEVRVEWVNGKQ